MSSDFRRGVFAGNSRHQEERHIGAEKYPFGGFGEQPMTSCVCEMLTAWHFRRSPKKSQLDLTPELRIFAKFGKSEVVLASGLGFLSMLREIRVSNIRKCATSMQKNALRGISANDARQLFGESYSGAEMPADYRSIGERKGASI